MSVTTGSDISLLKKKVKGTFLHRGVLENTFLPWNSSNQISCLVYLGETIKIEACFNKTIGKSTWLLMRNKYLQRKGCCFVPPKKSNATIPTCLPFQHVILLLKGKWHQHLFTYLSLNCPNVVVFNVRLHPGLFTSQDPLIKEVASWLHPRAPNNPALERTFPHLSVLLRPFYEAQIIWGFGDHRHSWRRRENVSILQGLRRFLGAEICAPKFGWFHPQRTQKDSFYSERIKVKHL